MGSYESPSSGLGLLSALAKERLGGQRQAVDGMPVMDQLLEVVEELVALNIIPDGACGIA